MKLIGYSSDDLPGRYKVPKLKTGICCYCERNLSHKQYTREHIIPKSKGGTITLPCCRRCNYLRGNKTLIEFKTFIVFDEQFTVSERILISENIDRLCELYPEAK